MTSVESALSRELDIRFIDARRLVIEAKIELGITGYADEDDSEIIFARACELFHKQDCELQHDMRKANWELESAKMPTGSQSLSDLLDSSTSSSNRLHMMMMEDDGRSDHSSFQQVSPSVSSTRTASVNSQLSHRRLPPCMMFQWQHP